MTSIIRWCIFLILLNNGLYLSAQDIAGTWKTIDDTSGEPRSVVRIYKKGTSYFGKVSKIYSKPGEDTDPVCDLCEDDRKDQRVIGMEIIRDLKFNSKSGEYSGGTIIDPENGTVYDCKMWLEKDVLKLRGYVYFFYRTQTWYPFDE
jgi:uncharacterized protein (DUF2147 family)